MAGSDVLANEALGPPDPKFGLPELKPPEFGDGIEFNGAPTFADAIDCWTLDGIGNEFGVEAPLEYPADGLPYTDGETPGVDA